MWSRLGVPYVVPFDELDKLKTLLREIQIETLTSIEALASRLANIEGKMSILEKVIDRRESSDNVFDFVSKEELGIEENVSLVEEPEYLTESDTDEIRYIESGFAAPPPEDEEIVYEPLAEEEEETQDH